MPDPVDPVDDLKVLRDLVELNKERNKSVKTLEEEADRLKMVADYEEKRAKTTRGKILAQNQFLEGLNKEMAALKKKNKIQLENSEITADEAAKNVRAQEERIIQQEQLIEKNEEFNHSLRDSVSAAEDLAGSLTNAFSSKTGNRLKGAYEGAKKFQEGIDGGDVAMAAFLKKFKGVAGIMVVGRFLDEIIELTLAVDKLAVSFRKGTLASKELTREITGNYKAMIKFGLTTEQALAGGQALFRTYTDFTMLTQTQRQGVTELSSTMMLLGVSAGSAAKAFQTATVSFGMSAGEARHTMRELFSFSQAAGLDYGEMITKFGEMGPALAKFSDVTGTFKDLARVSKITGMEMQKILALTDKFDTFEGAATQAGKLNAALGGNFVNAMDLMMTTDPVERFGMIRDSILNAGLSYESMSYYQKKYFAEAAGLENVADLSKLLRGDMDALGGATEEQAASLAELKQIGFDMMPVLTKFAAAFKAVFEDVNAEAFADALGGLADFVIFLLPLLKLLTGVIVGVGTALFIGFIAPLIGVFAPAIGTFLAAKAGLMGIAAGVGALVTVLGVFSKKTMKEKQSPYTILGGMQEMERTFEGIGTAAKSASPEIQTTTAAMETLPVDRATPPVGATAGSVATVTKQPMIFNMQVDGETIAKLALKGEYGLGKELKITKNMEFKYSG